MRKQNRICVRFRHQNRNTEADFLYLILGGIYLLDKIFEMCTNLYGLSTVT
jgi:hypothetical protein